MNPVELLSPRERQVYEMRVGGKRNKKIAAELGISQTCVAVMWSLANSRIRSGIKSRQSRAEQKYSSDRWKAVDHGKHCGRCRLRGEHVCL